MKLEFYDRNLPVQLELRIEYFIFTLKDESTIICRIILIYPSKSRQRTGKFRIKKISNP